MKAYALTWVPTSHELPVHNPRVRTTLDHFIDSKTDVYVYTGSIERSGYEDLCDILQDKKKGTSALLILMTPGGNPNAGYRIARALIHNYEAKNFRVAIPADCKSAGTLICIGAHSLVFFDKGEIGPLDVQFQKQDEIFQQSSGLDILRGMTYLRNEALSSFNEYLMEINGGSGLSTKTASEIASNLVKGLFEPMFAQIDPIRLGEMNAALQIAYEYGNRLSDKAKNMKQGALNKLINNYPTHGFVIDRAEARNLFERVERPTAQETEIVNWAMRVWPARANRTRPLVRDVIDFFDSIFPKEADDAADGTAQGGGAGNADAAGAVEGAAGAGAAPIDDGQQPPVEGQQGAV